MTILVIAEHDNAALKAATLNTVAAATKIGDDERLDFCHLRSPSLRS